MTTPDSHRPARVAVLLNARAKRVDARAIRGFQSVLPPDDVFVSASLEEGARQVRWMLERGYDTVLVGGGDGTLAAALNLVLRAEQQGGLPEGRVEPAFGVLKLGTGNALGAYVGAGRPFEDTRRVLAGSPIGTLGLRLLEDPSTGHVFPFASVGYDAQVLNDFVDVADSQTTPFARQLAKSIWGYAYAVVTRTLPTELRRGPTRFRVRSLGRASRLDRATDAEVELEPRTMLFEGHARAVLFGTTPFYGYGMRVLPFALRRPDRFHLRVSTASPAFVLARLPWIWRGTLRTPHFVDFLVEDVEVETSAPFPLQVSGDAGGRVERLRARLFPRSFRLLAR